MKTLMGEGIFPGGAPSRLYIVCDTLRLGRWVERVDRPNHDKVP